MPISCHFRDCKALLVTYSCKKRYNGYLTFTFNVFIGKQVFARKYTTSHECKNVDVLQQSGDEWD